MNANLDEAREKNLVMARIVGTRAEVKIEFHSTVVANFARRGALFSMSKIHQLHTIATSFAKSGGEAYLDQCNQAIKELRSELNAITGKVEDVKGYAAALHPSHIETFIVSVQPQMEMVKCYALLDAHAAKLARLQHAGKVRGAELNALVCEAKQPFKRAVGLFTESIETARSHYGANRVGFANVRAITMVQALG